MSLTVWDGITVGAVGGTLAGLTVWFFQLTKETIIKEIHKKRVYNWLYKKTKQYKELTVGAPVNDPRWISTEVIACYTNLPIERVRYICSIHKEIRPKLTIEIIGEEKWGIKEFVHMIQN